jgi:hypothetical protein
MRPGRRHSHALKGASVMGVDRDCDAADRGGHHREMVRRPTREPLDKITAWMSSSHQRLRAGFRAPTVQEIVEQRWSVGLLARPDKSPIRRLRHVAPAMGNQQQNDIWGVLLVITSGCARCRAAAWAEEDLYNVGVLVCLTGLVGPGRRWGRQGP